MTHFPALDDAIVAQATPPGPGALAVVRLSGRDCRSLAGRVIRAAQPIPEMDGHQGQHGWVVMDDEPVDEVVAWVYRQPRSYTGEDMVEVSCHGGTLSARRVIDAFVRAGARPALPGEFTRRAFLNGKVDLAQAEAVIDVIAARGERAHDLALAQLRGGLSRRVEERAVVLRDVLVRIEAHLDFGEDVPEAPDAGELVAILAREREELAAWIQTFAATRPGRDGWMVSLIGRPNVGKSSLLNALVGSERALVHESPGTTRDYLEAWVEWAGTPVRLVDTAGLRDAGEDVERAGIGRSRDRMRASDRILWVVDGSAEPGAEDRALVAELEPDRTVLVVNKQDLGIRDSWSSLWPGDRVRTSARTGDGLGALRGHVEQELRSAALPGDEESGAVTSERHVQQLREAAQAVERARRVLAEGHSLELGAADLHRGLDALAAITGERADERVLDEIFRRFCIGK